MANAQGGVGGSVATERPSTSALAAQLFRDCRVSHWAHFLLLPLAGIALTRPLAGQLWAGLRGGAIAAAVLAFGYLLNAITDRDTDLSPEKNAFVGRSPDVRALALLCAGLAAIALVLAVGAPLVVLACTATCLLSGLIYSAGPRLKAIPVVGTLTNVTNFAPLLAVGLASGEPPAGLLPLALAFTALLLQNQVVHEAADAEEDARASTRTTFHLLGPRGTALLVGSLGGLLATVVLVALGGALAVAGAVALTLVFAIAFPVAVAVRGHEPAGAARLRKLHRVASLAAGAALYGALYLAPAG